MCLLKAKCSLYGVLLGYQHTAQCNLWVLPGGRAWARSAAPTYCTPCHGAGRGQAGTWLRICSAPAGWVTWAFASLRILRVPPVHCRVWMSVYVSSWPTGCSVKVSSLVLTCDEQEPTSLLCISASQLVSGVSLTAGRPQGHCEISHLLLSLGPHLWGEVLQPRLGELCQAAGS